MATASSTKTIEKPFYITLKEFPLVIDGRINALEFLAAVSDLIDLVEHLGKALVPVRYDMQGNIDKIKKNYKYDESSCLLELMREEIKNGKHAAAEGILWLNRALLFFTLFFQEVINCLRCGRPDTSVKKLFVAAYERSIKKYHNWANQKIFALICKMAPSLPQILKSVEADQDLKHFESFLMAFNIRLHTVVGKIDDFFKENKLFD